MTLDGAPDDADAADATDDTDATEAADATRISSRRIAEAGDTVRLPLRAARADPLHAEGSPVRVAYSPDPAALRDAGPPRAVDPVRAPRRTPTLRAAQPSQGGAAPARSGRRAAWRRLLWLAAAAALVVAGAATLLVVVLSMPR